MSTFFTADTHFDHQKIIGFCNRPFKDVHEMNAILIMNWNNTVKGGDVVYHLGDFSFGGKMRVEEILSQLNGQIHWIFGNHDHRDARRADGFAWKGDFKRIRVGETRISLMHYAMRVWPNSHHGAWHLYGHSHDGLAEEPLRACFDVGVDKWEFKPVSYEQVADRIEKKIAFRRLMGIDPSVDHHKEL